MERHLREALLLQVGDDGVARELRLLDDSNDALKLLHVQRELELALSHVNDHLAHLALSVEPMNRSAGDVRNVEWLLERADDAVVAIDEAILDVVQRGKDEQILSVPRPRLNADRLVHHAQLVELAVRDDNPVFAQQRDSRHVRRPDHVLDDRRAQFGHRLALRHVEQRDALLRAQQDGAGSRGEHAIGACEWRRALLGHFVLQILDQDLPVLVEHGESLPSEENGGSAETTLAFLRCLLGSSAVARHVVKLVRAAIGVKVD
mmetsp:Transcript_8178/g.19177  ORF Transcript_8178/g.19177 Transcript_8178/m.19177 type:complete len:262 (+) Transcript_8178:495-1280(+)